MADEADIGAEIWRRESGELPRLDDRELWLLYRQLDAGSASALARRLVAAIEAQPSRWAVEALLRVACFFPSTLTSLHGRLLDADVFQHLAQHGGRTPIIFTAADPATLARLVELAEASYGARQGLAVSALTWNDEPSLGQRFLRWALAGTDVQWYAGFAGWELLEDGSRRSLAVSRHCHRLEAGVPPPPVATMEPSDAACGWCGRPLVVLLDLDLADERLGFLGFAGERLRILTCTLCTCWRPVFTDVDLTGGAEWSDIDEPSDGLGPQAEDLDPEDGFGDVLGIQLGLGGACRTPFEAFAFEDHKSTLGGFPEWIQNPEPPRCPRCDQTMEFLAQIDSGSEFPMGEGMIYAFVDTTCGLASTWYQQT